MAQVYISYARSDQHLANRFARDLRQSLMELVRRSPSVAFDGLQLLKFGEYVQTLLVPSNLNLFQMHTTPIKDPDAQTAMLDNRETLNDDISRSIGPFSDV